jgi:DNA-nicking Smr family endonuclease
MSKKSKKNKKFKELDYNFEEYDEEKEKEEIDEVLRLLQKTFSLSDDEMTKLLNYDFEDEDLKDIDKLVSILLNIYSAKEEEKEKKEKSKPVNNENINQEKENKLDIEPRSKLKDLIYSIQNEQKNNENSINNSDDFKPKNSNKRSIKVVNFNVRKAKEFLKMNENKKEIDLHGFTLVQSMYIVDKKLISLTEKKHNEKLPEITLTIITGVGHHSPDHKPVLHPQLTKYLKDIRKISVDEKSQKGVIFVTIY